MAASSNPSLEQLSRRRHRGRFKVFPEDGAHGKGNDPKGSHLSNHGWTPPAGLGCLLGGYKHLLTSRSKAFALHTHTHTWSQYTMQYLFTDFLIIMRRVTLTLITFLPCNICSTLTFNIEILKAMLIIFSAWKLASTYFSFTHNYIPMYHNHSSLHLNWVSSWCAHENKNKNKN